MRDYIHVVDLAKGHIAALKKLKENCGCKVGGGGEMAAPARVRAITVILGPRFTAGLQSGNGQGLLGVPDGKGRGGGVGQKGERG